MKEFQGYRVEHFFGKEPIMASQYLQLVDFIQEKQEYEEKMRKKQEKKK